MADEENGFAGWQVGSTYSSLLDHSEMNGRTKDPGRMMINFETTQVKDEFERIQKLGLKSSANLTRWAADGSRPWPTRMGITFNW